MSVSLKVRYSPLTTHYSLLTTHYCIMPDFCHLHNHTQYSLLDGASDISTLIKKAVQEEMKAVAITDHGNMFGVFEFVKEANKKHIQPIIGCEFYLVPDRLKKELIAGFGNDEDGTKGK